MIMFMIVNFKIVRYIHCIIHVFGWFLTNTVVTQCMEKYRISGFKIIVFCVMGSHNVIGGYRCLWSRYTATIF